MTIVDLETKETHLVEIDVVESGDYKRISKKRYFFNWLEERDQEVYKLMRLDEVDILGLVSLERIPDEWRIHIRLLSVSSENRGSDKKYENIAGNLITFVSQIATEEYGDLACVSLTPKGAIAQHYIDKYGMNITGATLSLELIEILHLIKIYDHD